jgi:hypothetical protein
MTVVFRITQDTGEGRWAWTKVELRASRGSGTPAVEWEKAASGSLGDGEVELGAAGGGGGD